MYLCTPNFLKYYTNAAVIIKEKIVGVQVFNATGFKSRL